MEAAAGPPVTVEILAHAPTAFFHCQHCELVWRGIGLGPAAHQAIRTGSLPDDRLAEWRALVDLVGRLRQRFGDRIAVRVVDAASVEGFWQALRWRIRRLPAAVIGRREVVATAAPDAFAPALQAALERWLSPPGPAATRGGR